MKTVRAGTQPSARQAKWKCQGILEHELRARGFRFVAGADEVGRGSLFGPVVAGAVILSPERPIRGLNDSKQIEPEQREILAERIRERAVAYAVASVSSTLIDRINIYEASRLAMKTALARLATPPDYVLVDAVPLDISIPQRPLVQGDERCHAIAAASILAKVYRDRMMCHWHELYPEYGLASHKGYSCPEHMAAIRKHGPTPLHRLSFEPVRAHAAWCHLPESRQLEMFATV